MSNKITELVFILDRSGSMAGLEKDTIGGFNSMLAKQKQQEGGCYVSTVLFDDHSKVLHDREKIDEVKPLTEEDYFVGGCTALIDAIGGAIHHIGKLHKYFGDSAPSRTVFVIITDGEENASHKYSSKQVKHMIERQKEKYGWEFLFIGANIDAVETAGNYGIDRNRAVNYNADSVGTQTVYEAVSKSICKMRACAEIDDDWSQEIDKDYKKRKRQK